MKRIKRALSNNIRKFKIEIEELIDKVFFKRDNDKIWIGPTTISIDGKPVIVKHKDSERCSLSTYNKDKKCQRKENRP